MMKKFFIGLKCKNKWSIFDGKNKKIKKWKKKNDYLTPAIIAIAYNNGCLNDGKKS